VYRDDAADVYDQVESRIRETGEFTVTDEHLKLLRNAYVDWNPMEFGAPSIEPKRPYGNSDVLRDIANILTPGWSDGFEDGSQGGQADEYMEQNDDRLTRLHAETGVALQIALATQTFAAGRYVLGSRYDDTSWRPAD
jgi:hypothetical protein